MPNAGGLSDRNAKVDMNCAIFMRSRKKLVKNKTALARLGFTVLTVNIAMQILTKRIITPLIATPMASFFKEKFEQVEANQKEKDGQKIDKKA